MNRIEFGDCRDTMRRWAEQGVKAQMCVTSPPYFGLRSYLPDDSPDKPLEIGLEETPEQYVARMVEVFRCVWDVLADDGICWINIGDSYAANRTYQVPSTKGGPKHSNSQSAGGKGSSVPDGLKPKDLIGIPWMLAFALRADGWYLRQEIIWHKPSPMPESVKDRCTKAHEQIFLLSKQPRYFFDSEAMKEPAACTTGTVLFSNRRANGMAVDASGNEGRSSSEQDARKETRNRRSVWTVATRPYAGAHFATFPADLIIPTILAGTSERGHCPECGARWVREVVKTDMVDTSARGSRFDAGKTAGRTGGDRTQAGDRFRSMATGAWLPTCSCGHDPVPDIVLDPFMGSGTTAAVALQHGRQYLGCELNPDYGPLQQQRIDDTLAALQAPPAKPRKPRAARTAPEAQQALFA